MAHLLTCSKLSKSFSAHPLFEGISLTIHDDDRIGLIGPNGAGKSTLLKILAGEETTDEGEIISRKGIRVAYLSQSEQFEPNASINDILFSHTNRSLPEEARHQRVGELQSIIGFEHPEQQASSLSGGWRKRLAIACSIASDPDLLLLDEPTNHLDLEGIIWLEEYLQKARTAYVVISHDRTFLEHCTAKTIEISRRYPQGFITIDGPYSEYLERREEVLAQLATQEQSLANTVRREIAWLRRGAKARSTKQNARIERAEKMISDLDEVKARARSATTVEIDFTSTGRETKQFVVMEHLQKSFGERKIVSDLTFTLLKGTKLGILGPNGAGKSTLLKLIAGTLPPDAGTIQWAHGLKIVTFEQQRNSLDPKVTLRRYLAPDGDSVVFQESLLHIVSYAKRFRFEANQLDVPVGSLSGGEQARLLISKLMLQPADLLLLDEPTNDLDIDTLQVLEENLISFPGAVVLITHDRFMIESVCTRYIAVERGQCEFFSSYDQWKEAQREARKAATSRRPLAQGVKQGVHREKEIQHLQRSIEKAEKELKRWESEVERHSATPQSKEFVSACDKFVEAQATVDELYERWQELEG